MAKLSKDPKLVFRVPPWASFFIPGEYADFVQLVSSDLRRRSVTAFVEEGFAILKEQATENQKISLLNLAQTCKAAPRSEWKTLIGNFFDSMLRIETDAEGLLEKMRDFDKVRDLIKVRLHGEGYMSHPQASHLVLRKVAPGLAALLVCDFGFVNTSVPASFLSEWGMSVDDLFALARKNVRAEGRLTVSEGTLLGGFSIDMMSGRTNYTASHALFFEDYLARGTGYGAILALPTRDAILRHIIRDMNVIEALRLMHMATRDFYAQGPGSISKELYWWRAGEIKLFPAVLAGGVLQLMPTEEFQHDVLDPIMQGN